MTYDSYRSYDYVTYGSFALLTMFHSLCCSDVEGESPLEDRMDDSVLECLSDEIEKMVKIGAHSRLLLGMRSFFHEKARGMLSLCSTGVLVS